MAQEALRLRELSSSPDGRAFDVYGLQAAREPDGLAEVALKLGERRMAMRFKAEPLRAASRR